MSILGPRTLLTLSGRDWLAGREPLRSSIACKQNRTREASAVLLMADIMDASLKCCAGGSGVGSGDGLCETAERGGSEH